MAATKLRCAIYTRKSSDEGLDQAFNSLHAQREACEAFVKSQAGEGWTVCPALYDDGGISGGTMERPALKRLLADVDRGLIDIVVVYKVDRLTRSLTDFSRIVERFDARSVSFVSITQAFNTTNSMGRLTLNVLLSFAQFEREVTGERIRDKIAASKAKGMWMGGNLPLGYDPPIDPTTRFLVVNPEQADEVRDLFERYLDLGSVHALVEELNAAGKRTRILVSQSGKVRGGVPWSRGALFHLLKNPVYIGQVTHRGKACPAGHPPILDRDLFDRVQAQLDRNRAARRDRPIAPDGSPLAGLIIDAEGLGMTPTIAYGKLGRKYRYYVSHALQRGEGKLLGRDVVRRVAAGAIEGLVVETMLKAGIAAADAGWRERRAVLRKVQVGRSEVIITIDKANRSQAAVGEMRQALAGGRVIEADGKEPTINLVVPGQPVYRGGRTWIAGPDGASISGGRTANPALAQALKRAHAIAQDHCASPAASIENNRAARGVADSYKRALMPLAYLAPDIQTAILKGQAPAGLTLEHVQGLNLPISWVEQRRALGFPAI